MFFTDASRPCRTLTIAVALTVAAVSACARDKSATAVATALRIDDFGDTIVSAKPAQRIVSLSPVTTEILFAMGAGARVVGRTHWDLYPDAARAVPDLGNGMQPNVEALLGVHPDLVVLYASNDNRAAARQLRAAGVATIAVRTDHVADFRRAVTMLARAVGDSAAGATLADSVERTLAAVRALPRIARPPRVFWFIWEAPLYTIGRGSYMNELTETAGAENVFGEMPAPSPQVTIEEVVKRNPDFILAGPETAARIRANPIWRAVPAVKAGHILVTDTTLVGRPGPRLGEAARHLRSLLLPDSARR